MYSRINLELTNYDLLKSAKFIVDPDFDQLRTIYYDYCNYKKFKSVMPFFIEDYQVPNNDIIGYYESNTLIAYSLILRYPSKNSVFATQFCWNYENPALCLGIKSLEHECALYKSLGYQYLYLGEASDYKSKFQGYELISR